MVLDPVAIQIGPITIYWYGVIITSAFVVGTALAYYNASRQGINPGTYLKYVDLDYTCGNYYGQAFTYVFLTGIIINPIP